MPVFLFIVSSYSVRFIVPLMCYTYAILTMRKYYKYILEDAMSSLFIIGNGFDIAHQLPTAYKQFRNRIIDIFPGALSRRDQRMYVDEQLDLSPYETAAELLLYAMDHASGEDWCDFESALSRINFYAKLPSPMEEAEDELSPKHDQRVAEYLLAMDMLSNFMIDAANLWPELFSMWIKEIQDLIERGVVTPHPSLVKLFADPSNKYMTFNYTKTIQSVYGIKGVKHIHNRVGQKLVFGHGEKNVSYNEPFNEEGRMPVGSSTMDDFMNTLQKDTVKQIRKYKDFFKSIDHTVDKVYSYGFGFGTVDNPYVKLVIDRISPDATWYFTAYECRNTESIRRKKIKLRRLGFKGKFDVFEG